MQRGKGKVEALERKLDRYPLTATRFSFPYVHFGKFLLARVLLGRKNRSLVLVETFQLSSKPFLSFSLFFFPLSFLLREGLLGPRCLRVSRLIHRQTREIGEKRESVPHRGRVNVDKHRMKLGKNVAENFSKSSRVPQKNTQTWIKLSSHRYLT